MHTKITTLLCYLSLGTCCYFFYQMGTPGYMIPYSGALTVIGMKLIGVVVLPLAIFITHHKARISIILVYLIFGLLIHRISYKPEDGPYLLTWYGAYISLAVFLLMACIKLMRLVR